MKLNYRTIIGRSPLCLAGILSLIGAIVGADTFTSPTTDYSFTNQGRFRSRTVQFDNLPQAHSAGTLTVFYRGDHDSGNEQLSVSGEGRNPFIGVTRSRSPRTCDSAYVHHAFTISQTLINNWRNNGLRITVSENNPGRIARCQNGNNSFYATLEYATAATTEDINVEEPVGTSLTDNRSSRSFGNVNLGDASPVMTFTVENVGVANLSNVAVTVTGGSASEFPLDLSGLSGTVTPSGSTQFSVQFVPTSSGVKSATLRIASSDPDENPFRVTLRGRGLDLEDPVITCPDSIIATNDLGECGAVVVYDDPIATDNGGPPTVFRVNGPASGSLFPVGTTTVAYVARDSVGRRDFCEFDVVVVDGEAPVAVARNVTLVLGANGKAGLDPQQLDNGSSDNCEIIEFAADRTSFSCADIGGAIPVQMTVFDEAGFSDAATGMVTVVDQTAPSFVVARYHDGGTPSSSPTYASPVVNASSISHVGGGGSIVDELNELQTPSGSVAGSPAGSQWRWLQPSEIPAIPDHTDVYSGFSIENASRTHPLFLADLSFDLAGPGTDFRRLYSLFYSVHASVNQGGFTPVAENVPLIFFGASTEGFYELPQTISLSGIPTLSPGDEVEIRVSYGDGVFFLDDKGAFLQGFEVTAIPCTNVTLELDVNGAATLSPDDVDAGIQDACGIASRVLSQSSFGCEDVGTNYVTMTVTDHSGNASTCSVFVAVQDNHAPSIDCERIEITLDFYNKGSLSADALSSGIFDACGLASLTVDGEAPSGLAFGCADVGTNLFDLVATDIHGNSSNCTATVVIRDQWGPRAIAKDEVVHLDENGEAVLTAHDLSYSSWDNCEIVRREFTYDGISTNVYTFQCADIGVHHLPIQVWDRSGNTDTATAVVKVEDRRAPLLICRNARVSGGGGGVFRPLPTASVLRVTTNDVILSLTDNCSSTFDISLSHDGQLENQIGTNIVVVSAIDEQGNHSTCNARVTAFSGELEVASLRPDVAELVWATGPGLVTVLECASSLDGPWVSVLTNPPPNAIEFISAQGEIGSGHTYYRVVLAEESEE